MAVRLGSVERTRRRLLADLGHEMRTPVATLEAYLEALEDGVATLDAKTAELLRSQTQTPGQAVRGHQHRLPSRGGTGPAGHAKCATGVHGDHRRGIGR